MDRYLQDIFYDLQEFSLDRMKQLLTDAKNVSYEWHVDRHDESFVRTRQPDFEFDAIMGKMDKSCHTVFIHRRGYESWREPDCAYSATNWCLEAGFSTMTGRAYYLFIYATEEEMYTLIDKYNLKPMK